MPLSDVAARNARPKKKPYKMADSEGLFLFVTPAGSKLWRMKYRFHGKEKLLSLGAYPLVGLKKARADRDAAKEHLAAGRDPGVEKARVALASTISNATTFADVAAEYIRKRSDDGLSSVTIAKAQWLIAEMGRDFGSLPIDSIRPIELLSALKRIEASGRLETAKRCLSLAGRVFRYAVVTARVERDISVDLRGALKSPRVKHHAAILDPAEFGGLLRAIDSFEGQPATLWALKIAPHVFVRPGELRQAEWSEINLDAAVWRIPGARMKMGREHAVPLSRQVLDILHVVKSVTGRGRYVFPSVLTNRRPMCENTLNSALRRLGYGKDEMTSHGFRATASSLLNESGKWSSDAIERALAHGDANGVRAVYHRGAHWKERVEMAQWWSDYLDELRAGAAEPEGAKLRRRA